MNRIELRQRMRRSLLTQDHVLQHYTAPGQRINGVEQKVRYNEVLSSPKETADVLSSRLGISTKIIGKWRNGQTPSLVRKAGTISNVFPFSVHRLGRDLRPLAKLITYALVSGYNAFKPEKGKHSRRTLSFNVRNNSEKQFVETELQKLQKVISQLKWKIVTTKGEGGRSTQNIQVYGEGGMALSRLFHETGVKYGAKRNSLTQLPLHVLHASEIGQIHGKEPVKTVLGDFLEVLKLTRGTVESSRTTEIKMPRIYNREAALRIKDQIETIAEQAGMYNRSSPRSKIDTNQTGHDVRIRIAA